MTTTRLFFCPECDGAMVPGVRKIKPLAPVYSESIKQAFHDWNNSSAYLDNNGNYRERKRDADGYLLPNGPIAPWNREVKRRFASCSEFHAAAVASRGELR